MLPIQFGEVNQIARVAEYVHSSSSDNESGEEREGGRAAEARGTSCAEEEGSERSLGPMCLRGKFVEGLGSLVEMCASNKTDGFRDEYSRTIRW